jgi:hypothetical protein
MAIDQASRPGANGAPDGVPDGAKAGQLAAPRPYTKPVLRHLGSVRDLTLGSSHRFGENKTMRVPGM